MKRVAVIFEEGFEEIEALTPVDVLRRAGIDCQMVGFSEQVTGSHGISVVMDRLWDEDLADFDMLVLPGGMPGAKNLRDRKEVQELLARFDQEQKWLAAICAAPLALASAGVLKDRHYTAYDGIEDQIEDGMYQKETVVVDGHVVTSRGPASALAFSYQLAHLLGAPADQVSSAMLYTDIFKKGV